MSAPAAAAAAANSRGMAALADGRAEAAAEAFAAAAAADPESGALLRNLASAQRALGDSAAEMAALERALDVDRRDLVAWLRKAELHQRLDQRGEALAAWNAALQLAEPLQPWAGPLQAALEEGRRFCGEALSAIRAAADEQLAPLKPELDPAETRRASAFVELALGNRQSFRNECAGLFYPFLPADEFFDERHFPWFADLAAAAASIELELRQLLASGDGPLRPYVQHAPGSPASKWTPLDGSLAWGACFLIEYGVPNKSMLERCPATAKALAAIPQPQIPGRSPNAFFSLLRPGARIPPHTGVTNTRAIVHLPLIVPPHCGFRVGGETRSWVPGQPFAFDDTIEHEAWNESGEVRAVLICDVWNPHLTAREQEVVRRYYAAADRAGYQSARES